MNIRIPAACRLAVLGIAAMISVAATSDVFAATKTPKEIPTAETCKSLEDQVDAAIASHPKAPKLASANKSKDEGTKLCSDGKYKDGSKKLHLALKTLGVKAVN
jgi:hypothetical protein